MASAETKAQNKVVLDLTREFLEAVRDRKDWHPFAQLRTREMKAAPNFPAFSQFRVIQTQNPGHGKDPEQIRKVHIEITIEASEKVKYQAVRGTLLVVRECDWEPCAECNGTGQLADETVCAACAGTGKSKLAQPRIPEKGSDTYDHDVVNGVWGVSPFTFEYLPESRRLLER